jgi:hypothetical protein
MSRCECCQLRAPLVFNRATRAALCVQCDASPRDSFLARRQTETSRVRKMVLVESLNPVEFKFSECLF